jgi:hypothetical protein
VTLNGGLLYLPELKRLLGIVNTSGAYMTYYNGTRTHLSLNKDAPVPRGAERLPPDRGRSPSSICLDLICDKDSQNDHRTW